MTYHRALEEPIEQLPALDEHGLEIEASQQETWDALLPTVSGVFDTKFVRNTTNRLGSEETSAKGNISRIGSELPGFVVARSIEPVMLALEGEHRYSRYALVFRIDRIDDERSRIRAETRARFNGRKGRMFERLVIATHTHVVVVNRILRKVKRRAES